MRKVPWHDDGFAMLIGGMLAYFVMPLIMFYLKGG